MVKDIEIAVLAELIEKLDFTVCRETKKWELIPFSTKKLRKEVLKLAVAEKDLVAKRNSKTEKKSTGKSDDGEEDNAERGSDDSKEEAPYKKSRSLTGGDGSLASTPRGNGTSDGEEGAKKITATSLRSRVRRRRPRQWPPLPTRALPAVSF